MKVVVYLLDNTIVEYDVATEHQCREHAKRIVTEGFQWDFGDGLTYYGPAWVFKVKLPDLKGHAYEYPVGRSKP